MSEKARMTNSDILHRVEQADLALPLPAADLELGTKLVPYEERHFKSAGLAAKMGYREVTPYYSAATVKAHARELATAVLSEMIAGDAMPSASQADIGNLVFQDIRRAAQVAGFLDVSYCLWCSKEGHRTTECHSTHSLNSPQALELSRLSRLAHQAMGPTTSHVVSAADGTH